jgi:hypothetical protein
MTEDIENIDNIYSESFLNYRPEPPEEEWTKLSAALRRQNFMKFGVAHFNIYYAMILAAITVLSIYVSTNKPLTPALQKHEKIEKKLIPSVSPGIQTMLRQVDSKNKNTLLNKAIIRKEDGITQQSVNSSMSLASKANADLSNKNTSSGAVNDKVLNEQKNDTIPVLIQTSVVKTEKKKIKKVTVVIKNTLLLNDSVVYMKK